MDLISHIESRDSFLEKIESALLNIRSISVLLNDIFAPKPGPYRIYNYIAATTQRCNEMKIIVERMYSNRILLLKSDLAWELARPKNYTPGIPYPDIFNELTREGDDLNKQIALDFQTMLIFTAIALDDWAHVAGLVLGVPNPTKSSFDKIAKDDGCGPYSLLWHKHKQSILWLDAIPRLYRNKMIVHREQPWQMGYSRSTTRLDWSFWTPVSVGWFSEQETKIALEMLSDIARSIGIHPEDRIQAVVMQLLRASPQLSREQRKEVLKVAAEFGFQTPSFQEFAHQLAEFLSAATDTLKTHITTHPGAVNLGTKTRDALIQFTQ